MTAFENIHDCDRCAALERTCDLHQEVERLQGNRMAQRQITEARVRGDRIDEHDCGCVFIEYVNGDQPARVTVCRDHYAWLKPTEPVAVGEGDPDCHFCQRWGKPCRRHDGQPTSWVGGGGQGKSFPKCPDCGKRVFTGKKHPCAEAGETRFVISASVDNVEFGPVPEPVKIFEDVAAEPDKYSFEAAVDENDNLEEVSIVSIPTSSCGYCHKRGAPCVRHGGERSGVYTPKKSKTLAALIKDPMPAEDPPEWEERLDAANKADAMPNAVPPGIALAQHEAATPVEEPEPIKEPEPATTAVKQPENAPDDSAIHTVTIRLRGIRLGGIAEIAAWTAERGGTIDVRPQAD